MRQKLYSIPPSRPSPVAVIALHSFFNIVDRCGYIKVRYEYKLLTAVLYIVIFQMKQLYC